MITNLPQIEEDIVKIHEKCTEEGTGGEWMSLAQYIGISILQARIDQELNPVALSDMQLELAKLEGK